VAALGSLNVPNELDFNFQLVACEIAQFAAETAAAAIRDPAEDDLHSHLILLSAFSALIGRDKNEAVPLFEKARQHPLANTKGDPNYIRALGDRVKRMTKTALSVYKEGEAAKVKAEDVANRVKTVKKQLDRSELPDQATDLAKYLQAHPPRSRRITPSTPELEPAAALAGPASDATQKKADDPKDHAASNSSGPDQ
jgi:hypothetical protein